MLQIFRRRHGDSRFPCPAVITAIGLFVSISTAEARNGQDSTGLWELATETGISIPELALSNKHVGLQRPLYLLNEGLLDQKLAAARPDRHGWPDDPQAPELSLPLPDGSFADFRFFSSPIMEPALASRYPQIRTFRIRAAADASIGGRAALTPLGFYAIVLAPGGPIHITPAYESPSRLYSSVFESEVPTEPLICSAEDVLVADSPAGPLLPPRPTPSAAKSSRNGLQVSASDAKFSLESPVISGMELRDYRMAVATTSEYYFGRGGNDLAVLISIVIDLLRVDAIYESELAISFTLIQDTDMLFFTDPDAYLQDGVACNLKDENQGVVDAVLADADYDIAIVLDARSNTSGGCASGSGVCVSNVKARVAAGLDTTKAPGHESFGGYRLMLHEIGHIFGAGHTWSGQQGNCTSDQFAASSAFEPGSGSTVMSYSGTCGSIGADDIQNSTADPYFHIWSIEQIVTFSTTGAGDGCALTTLTSNQPPSVNAGSDYTIPADTPFVLSGSASDPDGDELTYTWEQFDLATGRFALGTDDGIGPIIRSHIPDSSPQRTIPPLADLFSGTESPGELLPQDDRTLTFRLTARDNLLGGGGVNDDTMEITVDGEPFAITNPNGGEGILTGCPADVEWTVGGGDVAANVNIDLTTDDGDSFQSLAMNVANDGEHSFSNFGCFDGGAARVRVSAVGNIFFDISDGDFYIINNPPEIEVSTSGGSVDEECEFEVTFEATVTDDCSVSADDVEVSVDLLTANATLGTPTINIAQVNGKTVSVSGSVMVSNLSDSPAQVGVSVTASDNCGNDTSEADIADVEDTTPPTIEVSLSPDTIFPPNGKMVDILANIDVEDNCDANPEIVLLSVVSSEPENAEGDGNTAPDILGADTLTPDLEFQVRAERMGDGDGRIYTAEYAAADASSNIAQDSATVTVPNSQGSP